MTGWTVCRFHGARGGGPKGERNGMFKHGLATKEKTEERRALTALLKEVKASLSSIWTSTSSGSRRA